MKREWILWNALCAPEWTAGDERMKEIERKGYYWSYRILSGILYAFVAVLYFWNIYLTDSPAVAVPLQLLTGLVLGIIAVIELGRFLYSCYHGTQECAGSKSGRRMFISNGILAGLWMLFGAWGYWGIRDIRAFIAAVLAALFYWFLCHLAYLPYAWSLEEETEKTAVRYGKVIAGICAVLLTVFALFAGYGILRTFSGNAIVFNGSLTEEEREAVAAIKEGRDRYGELESVKLECFYREIGEDENEPYQNSGIAHCYYWVTPDYLYTSVLDPVTGDVCREGWRDAELEWHVMVDGSWTQETDHSMGSTLQPYAGMLSLQTEAIEQITEETRGGQTVYTVEYGRDYETFQEGVEGKENPADAGAMEEYILNEYGVVTGYTLEEYELSEEGERICARRRAFILQCADPEQNGAEVRKLIGQYPLEP